MYTVLDFLRKLFDSSKNNDLSLENIEIKNTRDIEKLMRGLGPERAGKIMRTRALEGNLICQLFFASGASMLPEADLTDSIRRDFEVFTKMAAENGDAGSQFNLALLFVKKVDSTQSYFSGDNIENLKQAKHWHQKAASQGFKPSIQSLKNLESVFDEI